MTINLEMNWLFFIFFLINFIFSEAKHHPSASILGKVYCDACSLQQFSKTSHFIPGASVGVECRNLSLGDLSFRKEVKTNEHGEFRVDLPFPVTKHANKIKRCSVTLLRSSDLNCDVASKATSNFVRLKSKKGGIHVFSAGFFSFKPLNQPNVCSQKLNHQKSLKNPLFSSLSHPSSPSPAGNDEKHPETVQKVVHPLDFFPPNPFFPPPILPPNPLLPPPSIFPPLQPPPSIFPPLQPPPSIFPPLQPPPSIFPPNPFQPPPAPFFPLPPIPGLTPPPSPPPFPFPLPPIPLPPIPGLTPTPSPPPPPPAFPFPLPPIPLPPIPGLTPVPGLTPTPSPPPSPSPPAFPFPLPPIPRIPGVPPAAKSSSSPKQLSP